jgi:CRP/FNR family transcriptional regulator, nitrogen oxide reductase regulator
MTARKSPVRLDWIDPAACTLDYRLRVIGRLPFFKALPAAAIQEINTLFHDYSYSAGRAVYFEGDAAQHLYLVALGRVKLVRNTSAGHEVWLDVLHGGEYFGNLAVLGAQAYAETAVALTECCILQISSGDFETILKQHPEVTLKVLSAVGQRLQQSQEVVKQLSSYTVEQRVASVLCRLAGKLGEEREEGVLIQLPFSRQDLASMAGTTTETVSRVMSRFAQDGLVQTGRKWVTVTDLQGLADLLNEGAVN